MRPDFKAIPVRRYCPFSKDRSGITSLPTISRLNLQCGYLRAVPLIRVTLRPLAVLEDATPTGYVHFRGPLDSTFQVPLVSSTPRGSVGLNNKRATFVTYSCNFQIKSLPLWAEMAGNPFYCPFWVGLCQFTPLLLTRCSMQR